MLILQGIAFNIELFCKDKQLLTQYTKYGVNALEVACFKDSKEVLKFLKEELKIKLEKIKISEKKITQIEERNKNIKNFCLHNYLESEDHISFEEKNKMLNIQNKSVEMEIHSFLDDSFQKVNQSFPNIQNNSNDTFFLKNYSGKKNSKTNELNYINSEIELLKARKKTLLKQLKEYEGSCKTISLTGNEFVPIEEPTKIQNLLDELDESKNSQHKMFVKEPILKFDSDANKCKFLNTNTNNNIFDQIPENISKEIFLLNQNMNLFQKICHPFYNKCIQILSHIISNILNLGISFPTGSYYNNLATPFSNINLTIDSNLFIYQNQNISNKISISILDREKHLKKKIEILYSDIKKIFPNSHLIKSSFRNKNERNILLKVCFSKPNKSLHFLPPEFSYKNISSFMHVHISNVSPIMEEISLKLSKACSRNKINSTLVIQEYLELLSKLQSHYFSVFTQEIEIEFKWTYNNMVQKPDNISEFISFYPESKPLYHILRLFLHKEKLDDYRQGGLSSYSIYLLVLVFLQYQNYISQNRTGNFSQMKNLPQNKSITDVVSLLSPKTSNISSSLNPELNDIKLEEKPQEQQVFNLLDSLKGTKNDKRALFSKSFSQTSNNNSDSKGDTKPISKFKMKLKNKLNKNKLKNNVGLISPQPPNISINSSNNSYKLNQKLNKISETKSFSKTNEQILPLSIGHTFIKMLQFYSDFNFETYCLTPSQLYQDPRYLYCQKNFLGDNQHSGLSIISPFNPNFIITKGFNQSNKLKTLFKRVNINLYCQFHSPLKFSFSTVFLGIPFTALSNNKLDQSIYLEDELVNNQHTPQRKKKLSSKKLENSSHFPQGNSAKNKKISNSYLSSYLNSKEKIINSEKSINGIKLSNVANTSIDKNQSPLLITKPSQKVLRKYESSKKMISRDSSKQNLQKSHEVLLSNKKKLPPHISSKKKKINIKDEQKISFNNFKFLQFFNKQQLLGLKNVSNQLDLDLIETEGNNLKQEVQNSFRANPFPLFSDYQSWNFKQGNS